MLTCMMLMKVRELGGGIKKSHHPRGLALNLESSLVVFSLQCVTIDGGLFFLSNKFMLCARWTCPSLWDGILCLLGGKEHILDCHWLDDWHG